MAPPIKGDLRIVMLGMTGYGKSATGNTILKKDAFKVDFNPESVTQKSEKKETIKGRRHVLIVDTPGLQDTLADEKEVKEEIEKCMEMSAPGPNVFLLVIRVDVRYTNEVKNTVTWIREFFGEEAARFTIVLFTYVDQLKSKPLQDHIEESPDLRQFVMSCGGRYHAFNNQDKENQDQVNELLDKMDEMVLRNEGQPYTLEMFREVQRRRTEEKERQRQSENERLIQPIAAFSLGVSFAAVCGIVLIAVLKTLNTST